MTAVFDDAVAGANADLNDLLATAAFVTATTIASAVSALAGAAEERLEVIASGGGTRNDAIMSWLRSMLREGTSLRVTDDLMIPSGAKEAVAFALLAAATLDGLPSNVPSATGASRAVVLGSITPKP